MSDRHSRTRSKAATSTDVAKLAGVSRSAVSRTFTTGASVAPETRQRVMKAAEALRYRPNLLARSLITRRSMIVALAITHLDNQFYPAVVQNISERLGEAGYRLLLYMTHGEESHEPLLDELLRYGVDGLILASRGSAPALLHECAAAGLPVVLMNNAGGDAGILTVTGDNLVGSATVARFLLAGGHRRFAYLAGIADVSSSVERHDGFSKALVQVGMTEPQVIAGGFDFAVGFEACMRLFSRKTRPDALFCANDHMAFAALQAARASGLEPGRDISIVGFDDVAISQWPSLALTTYSQPPAAMAAATVELLQAAMAADAGVDRHCRVAGRLVVRDTARRPATGLVQYADGSHGWNETAT